MANENQEQKETKQKEIKSRWWACILYPDSCKSDFREILNSKNIDWICSPLHDKDKNELDNELKKAHYHLMFTFNKNGSSRLGKAQELAKELGANEFVQPVCDLVNSTKYLIHLNNPEKYQYNKSDITCGIYVDLDNIIKLTKSEERQLNKDIAKFINENCIGYYHELIEWCASNNDEWFDYIIQHTYHFSMLCKSITAQLRELQNK